MPFPYLLEWLITVLARDEHYISLFELSTEPAAAKIFPSKEFLPPLLDKNNHSATIYKFITTSSQKGYIYEKITAYARAVELFHTLFC